MIFRDLILEQKYKSIFEENTSTRYVARFVTTLRHDDIFKNYKNCYIFIYDSRKPFEFMDYLLSEEINHITFDKTISIVGNHQFLSQWEEYVQNNTPTPRLYVDDDLKDIIIRYIENAEDDEFKFFEPSNIQKALEIYSIMNPETLNFHNL